MASRFSPTIDDNQIVNMTFDTDTIVYCFGGLEHESNPSKTIDLTKSGDDILIDNSYLDFREKLDRIKLHFPTDLEKSNVLWSIDTASPLHIGHLPHLLTLNILNKSHKTFSIINDLPDCVIGQSAYKILKQLKIGSLIRLDDIYYTKDYQRSFLQLTHSVKIIEAIESIRQDTIETYRVSDLLSILLIINNILYFNISHVLIGEHQSSLYIYIRSLLSNEYGRTLTIVQIPMLPNFDEIEMHSSSIQTNEILLDATKDQIHERFSKVKSPRKDIIHNYLKAMIDTFYNDESLFHVNVSDMIDEIRKKIFLSESVECDAPIYVGASFLTDQFDVLKKHWKKHVNKDDKCTGTGKGIDGLQPNQKGFEPQLGGKFIIINWSNKEIVYTLDIDVPAGFFLQNNSLYIANNRLHYISIIDLVRRIEINRIENPAFNCLHSLHRIENEILLLTSTGIDAIIQTNFNGEILNDWYATEHGYSITPKGEKRYVQRDFNHHHYIYPTLHQTTHINSAIVFDSDYYLATLFHQGLLVKINRTTGECEVLLSGLNCPHGIKHYRSTKQPDIVWILCNTKQNQLLFLNSDFKITERMILEDINWLQDAIQISNGNILITDANHSRIIEIDPLRNTVISELDYSADWRIYQISDLNDFQTNFIPIKQE